MISKSPFPDIKNELRLQSRAYFTPHDRVMLKGTLGKEQVRGLVRELNSFGGLVAITRPEGTLNPGDILERLEVEYHDKKIASYHRAFVLHVQEEEPLLIIGLKFDAYESRYFEEDTRDQQRVPILSQFLPQVGSVNPFAYEHRYVYSMLDVNNHGALLLTSIRNRLLLRGSKQDLEIYLPTVGLITAPTEIIYLKPYPEQNRLFVGIRFIEANDALNDALVRFLINFADVGEESVTDVLKRAGFHVRSIRNVVDFGYVNKFQEFLQVVQLRYQTYKEVGDISEENGADHMTDQVDYTSKILVARNRGQIVASCRVSLSKNENEPFELDAHAEFPEDLPREKTLEMSRLCVHSGFRCTDVFIGLFERCIETAVKAGAHYIITSSLEEMIPFYEHLGFRNLERYYSLPMLNDIRHVLMLFDIRAAGEQGHTSHDNIAAMLDYLERYGFKS